MEYLLLSHGEYAQGCYQSLEMIVGDVSKFHPLCFFDTMSKEEYAGLIEEKISQLPKEEVCLVADIVGGTPFNCALELQAKYEDIKLCTGLSLNLCIVLATGLELKDAVLESQQAIKVFEKMQEVELRSNQVTTTMAETVKNTGFDVRQNLNRCQNQSMQEKGIVAIRVDERLIHGQVATMWTNYTNAQRILIVDNQTCQDDIAKVALKTATPKGVKLSILTKKGALERINAGQYQDQRVLMLAKRPSVLFELIQAGLNIDTYNIGNCSSHDETLKVKKSVYLYETEIKQINELLAQGCKITAQMVPSDEPLSIEHFLNSNEER
jgi:PTS system mannose-specific IIB component